MRNSQRRLVTLRMTSGTYYAVLEQNIANVYKETGTNRKDVLVAEFNVTKKKWLEHEALPFAAKEKVAELATAKVDLRRKSELSA